MIYQILFVFALLIVALNDASVTKTKEEFKFIPKDKISELKRKFKDVTIEWDSSEDGRTNPLKKGFYFVYKKNDDGFKLQEQFPIKNDDETYSLCQLDGFQLGGTYFMIGWTHEDMKFGECGNPIEMNVSEESRIEWIRSLEKEFKEKEDVSSSNEAVASTNEGKKETNGWSFKKKMIIFGLIAVAVVWAFCACGVLGWCHLKKK